MFGKRKGRWREKKVAAGGDYSYLKIKISRVTVRNGEYQAL